TDGTFSDSRYHNGNVPSVPIFLHIPVPIFPRIRCCAVNLRKGSHNENRFTFGLFPCRSISPLHRVCTQPKRVAEFPTDMVHSGTLVRSNSSACGVTTSTGLREPLGRCRQQDRTSLSY